MNAGAAEFPEFDRHRVRTAAQVPHRASTRDTRHDVKPRTHVVVLFDTPRFHDARYVFAR